MTLARLLCDKERSLDLDKGNARRIYIAVVRLYAGGGILNWYPDIQLEVEDLNLPALHKWNRRIQTFRNVSKYGETWTDLRGLSSGREVVEDVIRKTIELTVSVESLLHHLDVWVRVIEIQHCTNEFSQERLSRRLTADDNVIGNASFNRLLSPREFRSFATSDLPGSSVQDVVRSGKSVVLFAVLPRPVRTIEVRPAYHSLDYFKLQLEPRCTTANGITGEGHLSVRLTAGWGGRPRDDVVEVDLSDQDSRLNKASDFFVSAEMGSVDSRLMSGFIRECQREIQDRNVYMLGKGENAL